MFYAAKEIPGKKPFLYFLHTSGCIMNDSFRPWFLGGDNGSRALSFGGGNGTSKTIAGNKIDSSVHGVDVIVTSECIHFYILCIIPRCLFQDVYVM